MRFFWLRYFFEVRQGKVDILEVVGEAQVQAQVALLAGEKALAVEADSLEVEEVLEAEVLEINLQFESKKV